jgi:choline dehydrogenase-like flavoprotein
MHSDDRTAVRTTLALTASRALYAKPLWDVRVPDASSHGSFDRFIHKHTNSILHYSGTCAVALRDRGEVVNASLRVHDVCYLHLTNTRAIPAVLAAHLQASVFTIAEKRASTIAEATMWCTCAPSYQIY